MSKTHRLRATLKSVFSALTGFAQFHSESPQRNDYNSAIVGREDKSKTDSDSLWKTASESAETYGTFSC